MTEINKYNKTATLESELQEAAFEYLLLNPGSEFGDWQQGLISDYPAEVVDALGTNPPEVYASLTDLWESEYEDPKTRIRKYIHEWAKYFATEQAVDIYYQLIEPHKKTRQTGVNQP